MTSFPITNQINSNLCHVGSAATAVYKVTIDKGCQINVVKKEVQRSWKQKLQKVHVGKRPLMLITVMIHR